MNTALLQVQYSIMYSEYMFLYSVTISLLGIMSIGGKTVTVEEVIAESGITADDLLKVCSPATAVKLSQVIHNWKLIGQHLGLLDVEISNIDVEYRTIQEKRVRILEKWIEKNGVKATYWKLVEVLLGLKEVQAAVVACKVVKAASSG